MTHNPFGPHDYGGPSYWLRPQDTEMERKHLALLNEAERLERLSAALLRGQRADRLAEPKPGGLDIV